MHDTALDIGRQFFEIYASSNSIILELGSLNVNGSLRDVSPKGATYFGVDAQAGPGVDVVIEPNKPLPFGSDYVDIVVSSSVFEHDLFFWETFLEMVRVVKPDGVIYLNAPSNGIYHCYPVDNWRFYPDSGKALELWARKNGVNLTLVESFIAERCNDLWNDFVAIFRKADLVTADGLTFLSVPSTNVWRFGCAQIDAKRKLSEDMVMLARLREDNRLLRVQLEEKALVIKTLTDHLNATSSGHPALEPDSQQTPR